MLESVQISMATTPERVRHALEVARQLRPQCDRLVVYVNGVIDADNYPGEWLMMPEGDLVAAGKFYDPPGFGWHLTVDDDLVYPPQYVDTIIAHAKRLGGIVSYHGKRVPGTISSYFGDLIKYRVLGPVLEDERIHIPGTGCMAYNVDFVGDAMMWQEMIPPHMVDLHAGRWAARRGVPCWVLRHGAREFEHRDIPLSDTLWAKNHVADHVQTWYVNHTDWPRL